MGRCCSKSNSKKDGYGATTSEELPRISDMATGTSNLVQPQGVATEVANAETGDSHLPIAIHLEPEDNLKRVLTELDCLIRKLTRRVTDEPDLPISEIKMETTELSTILSRLSKRVRQLADISTCNEIARESKLDSDGDVHVASSVSTDDLLGLSSVVVNVERTEQNHNSVNSSGKVSSTSPVDATTEHYIHKEDTDTLTIKQLEEKVANLATENSYLQNKIQERLAAEEEMKAMLKSHEEENLQVNCIQDENKSLLKQVSDLRERLESQAKRQVEQSGLSESLGDPQRSSELARRYTELYDSSVLQLLDQLDSFDNLTEDDLNHFALEIFKECIAATDRCIMNQVSSVSEFLHCNESNRGEVRDSIRATVLLNLRSNKDKAIDINSIKEDVLRFIKLPVQWSESCEESVIQSVALFVMDCLKFLLDVKCQGNSYTFESFDGIQFQTDRHRRYHSSSTTGVHVKQYVWPAFIDVSVDIVLCKGWVIT